MTGRPRLTPERMAARLEKIWAKTNKYIRDTMLKSLGWEMMTSPERLASVVRDNRLFFIKKLGGKCVKCGYDENPSAIQFDHIDPKLKKLEVHNVLRLRNKAKIWRELRKCQLLCATHHMEKTHSIDRVYRGGGPRKYRIYPLGMC